MEGLAKEKWPVDEVWKRHQGFWYAHFSLLSFLLSHLVKIIVIAEYPKIWIRVIEFTHVPFHHSNLSAPRWVASVFSGCLHSKKMKEGNGMAFFFFPFFFIFFISFIFFFFHFISWRLITLQYSSGFCRTLTWISHGFTFVVFCYYHQVFPERAGN